MRTRGIEVLDDELSAPEDTDSSEIGNADLSGLDNIASDDTVSLYLKEMAITPLLTVAEELSLAKRIARGRQARREITRYNGQDPQGRLELEALILEGLLAREAPIKANTRLVVSIARRYIGRGVPFLDLIQEGNLGLMKAVEKYEYQRGFRFSTYATWWIRQSIIRSIADQGRTICVPVHMIDRLRQIYKATRDGTEARPDADAQELAVQLDLDSAKLRWMLQVSQQPISLESPVGDEEDSELGMYVEDSASPSPAQLTYENMLREQVDEVLATLSPRSVYPAPAFRPGPGAGLHPRRGGQEIRPDA